MSAKYPSTRLCVFTYGGLEAECHSSLLHEAFFAAQHEVQPMEVNHISEDALISRARSRAATLFLDQSECEVLVMIDRDISWKRGDAMHIAALAAERNAIVGGLYACRAYGQGMASRLKEDGAFFTAGGDKVHVAEHVATGFMAIPKTAFKAVYEKFCWDKGAGITSGESNPIREDLQIKRCAGLSPGDPPFLDFFRPVSVQATHKDAGAPYEYLSEDWAFCLRARAADVPCLITEKPELLHWGRVPVRLQDGNRPRVGDLMGGKRRSGV